MRTLFIHTTPGELVGILSGVGSFGLSIITAWHYLMKIRDMKSKRRKDNDKNKDENGKG
jgi:hypothetical protein